ncbi:trypsin [Dictyocaulus viviparus]|uniref:Trypsin n=1 Tax=Dictyocaulus viviparus TaxID=29172 RepID=A0A0D8Y5L2_DICVI|nr:trypsin [Dictyocaulus viviparus]
MLYTVFVFFLFCNPCLCKQNYVFKAISTRENRRLLQLCDENVKTVEKRMMNAVSVKKGEMKYAVMLDIGNGASRCAGVIISRQHVLTAAHCFVAEKDCRGGAEHGKKWKKRGKTTPVYVHLGGNCVNVQPNGKCPKSEVGRAIKAAQIGVSGRYFESKCLSGDIAIVQLNTVLPKDADYYDIACLPRSTTKLNMHNLASAGYGYDPNHASVAEKHLERVTYDREPFCDPSIKVGKDVFCVVERNQFACKGDSGSGVMQPANKIRSYVMGVLSKGLNCNDVQIALKQHPQRILQRVFDLLKAEVVMEMVNGGSGRNLMERKKALFIFLYESLYLT